MSGSADQASPGGAPGPLDVHPPAAAASYRSRLLGVVIAGALFATVAGVVLAAALTLVARWTHQPGAAGAPNTFLRAGGWLWLPLWGAAFGALRALAWARRGARLATLVLAIVLVLLPVALRPEVVDPRGENSPRTPQAKARAILKWSYRTPATVAKIVGLSRDPDPILREKAVLALGVNLVVNDIEHAAATRPSKYGGSPVRDSLRLRLIEALHDDPAAAVRVEAARALWKAPIAFGPQPAAAETLAVVLDRTLRPSGAERRMTWLALDAAAGAPHSRLRAAAARFAAATPDTELARAARFAADRKSP